MAARALQGHHAVIDISDASLARGAPGLIQAQVSDLALDPVTGDLLVRGGDLVLAMDAEAIAQDWARRMSLFKGEWKLDRRVGIDYPNVIFAGRPSAALLRHIFETVTRRTAGIASLERLEFTLDSRTRVLTVSAQVTAVSGQSIALVFSNVLFEEAAQ